MKEWMESYASAVQRAFGDRIWFLGLQGSRSRGEAGPESDIDVVLILDALSTADLLTYRSVLDQLPMREKICGFVSGKAEIEAWEKSELFQFCRDTTPIIGSLERLLAAVSEEDLCRAIRLGACNVYHACGHNLLHGRSAEALSELYKSAVFALRAIAYQQTGSYARRQSDLAPLLSDVDRGILENHIQIKQNASFAPDHFEELSAKLLSWASGWIVRMA